MINRCEELYVLKALYNIVIKITFYDVKYFTAKADYLALCKATFLFPHDFSGTGSLLATTSK